MGHLCRRGIPPCWVREARQQSESSSVAVLFVSYFRRQAGLDLLQGAFRDAERTAPIFLPQRYNITHAAHELEGRTVRFLLATYEKVARKLWVSAALRMLTLDPIALFLQFLCDCWLLPANNMQNQPYGFEAVTHDDYLFLPPRLLRSMVPGMTSMLTNTNASRYASLNWRSTNRRLPCV